MARDRVCVNACCHIALFPHASAVVLYSILSCDDLKALSGSTESANVTLTDGPGLVFLAVAVQSADQIL